MCFLNDNELSYNLLVINGLINVLDQARQALNRAVTLLIESQRDNFVTGWSDLNIPPLEPFFLENFKMEPDDFTGFSA